MIKFKIHRLETNETLIGTAEDLGLCYVTKFVVNNAVIYSFTFNNTIDRVTTTERLEADKATLEANGLYDIEIID